MFNPILRELDWDPPRIMSTAFMWYINEPRMLDDMEGWYGVDQVGQRRGRPEPELLAVRAPLRAALRPQGDARDARLLVRPGARRRSPASPNAPLLDPHGVVKGLETLTMRPTVSGGPRSYISFGPYDRKGFKGDFLTVRHIVDGVPEFDGYLSTVYPSTQRTEDAS